MTIVLRKVFPHPYLSLVLGLVWMLLVNRLAIGSLVMATFLAVVIPHLTSSWWPGPARVRNGPALIRYVVLVVWDVIVANFQVARIILFMPADQIQSAWVRVPVSLTSPEAIALLSGTITMTPGTLTADMSACGRYLLIHSLHAPDPDAIRDDILARYETRLKRIFE